MTLHLSHRQQAILEEMGIGLSLKKPIPLRSSAEQVHPAHLGAPPHVAQHSAPTLGSRNAGAHPPREPLASPSPTFGHTPTKIAEKSPRAIKSAAPGRTPSSHGATSTATSTATAPSPSRTFPLNPESLLKVPEMSWPMLHEHLQHCQACAHAEGATERVFSTPPYLTQDESRETTPVLDWLIVADTPKRSLEGSGIAFSEEGLAFLNVVLKHLGFSTGGSDWSQEKASRHHISHTLKCLGQSAQVPSAVSVQTCLVHLKREIQLLRPRLLLVMGQSAAQALLYDSPLVNEPLGRLRSQVHQFENTPMVITYTPEQMMRSGENKAKAWNDLCLAHSLCE
jgi:uracil-DNA glycosylase